MNRVRKQLDRVVSTLERRAGKAAFNAIPVRTHLAIARQRDRLHRNSAVPDHVVSNVMAAFAQRGLTEVKAIARAHVEFSRRIDVMTDLTRHPGFMRTRRWEVAGTEYLDDALSSGRGAILMTGHLGFPKMIPVVLRAEGYDTVILRLMGRKEAVRYDSMRSTKGEIPAGLDIRPVLAALAENSIVVIACDGLRSSQFVRLSLLGKEYPFPTGSMKIAMISGASVLFAVALEGQRGRACVIRILPPLQVDPGAAVEHNVALYACVLDHELESRPHLWHRWGIENVFERVIEWSVSEDRWNRGFTRWG